MPQCLIVDDSRVLRKLARGMVESLGYSVEEAEHGEIALAKCKQAMPELILLDWNMPVMDGLVFLKSLRGLPSGAEPKVIFCTTNNDPAQIMEGLEAGADEYVMKPFDKGILQDKIAQVGL